MIFVRRNTITTREKIKTAIVEIISGCRYFIVKNDLSTIMIYCTGIE
jgi:hypothetical protein